MRGIVLSCLLLLASCATPYSLKGKVVDYVTHSDPDTLWEVCGQEAKACVLIIGNYCEIHHGERVSPYVIEHEERHCAGQKGVDMPPIKPRGDYHDG